MIESSGDEMRGSGNAYLFACTSGSSGLDNGTVFFLADNESAASTLCRMLQREYSDDTEKTLFTFKRAEEIPIDEQVFFDEALGGLELYDDADPAGVAHSSHLLA